MLQMKSAATGKYESPPRQNASRCGNNHIAAAGLNQNINKPRAINMDKVFFLPNDYQAPKSSNHYMKFQEGENKFRILSQPIIGWEDWIDKKPIRFRFDQKPGRSVDPKKPIRHFWAMVVWNYNAEEIQILHLTQATLRKSLESLCTDKDWGLPYFYDLKVMKTGEGIETEYVLNPLPHRALSPHIRQLFNERPCHLEALFDNEDPFSKDHSVYTQGIFSEGDVEQEKISIENAYELEMILGECDEKYKQWVYDYIRKQYNTDNLGDLPADIFDRMKAAAVKNMEANYQKQRQNQATIEPDFFAVEVQ